MRFLFENRLVDAFISGHHGVYGKQALHALTASGAVDIEDKIERLDRLCDAVHQKARESVLNHFTARTEIPCDHRNARRIGFGQHQPKPFRDGIEMQERPGAAKQFVLAFDADRTDVADLRTQVGFDLVAKILLDPE